MKAKLKTIGMIALIAALAFALANLALPSDVANAESATNVNISGVVTWVDKDGRTHNASDVTVEILVDLQDYYMTLPAATVVTNTEGRYNVSISNEILPGDATVVNVRMRVSSVGGNINVVDSSLNTYSITKTMVTNYVPQTALTLNFCIDAREYTDSADVLKAKAFRVHQALDLGARYVETKKGSKLDSIDAIFTTTEDGSCFTEYYSKEDGRLTRSEISIDVTDVDEWDVILHEYGHYVSQYYNIKTPNIGDEHGIGECNNLTRGKGEGMPLTWNEGWATYFSISAQLEMNAASLNIDHVGDVYYTDIDYTKPELTINVSLESPDISEYRYGESNEIALAAVLFDLADSGNANDDNIELGFSFLWNFINDTQCKTLPAFLDALFLQGNLSGAQKREVNRILTMYDVAPEPLSPDDNKSYLMYSATPVFEWNKNGGECGHQEEGQPSCDYSNNLFVLEFYNADYELIYTTPQVQGVLYKFTCSYAFSNAEWATLLNLADGVVHWTVKAWQTTEFPTGPYSSEYRTLNVPKIHTLSEQAPVQSEGFAFLGSDWYKFVAPADGKYAFLTTGTSDTYGELFGAMPFGDSSITCLENGSDDNSGDGNNFRIEYTLQKDSVVYLRIRGNAWRAVGSYVAKVVTVHQHVFTYRYIDANYHRLKCDCGAYSGMKSFHEIDSTYVNPNGNGRFKPCLYCRAMLDTWNGKYPIIKDKVPDDVIAASNPPQRACASDGCDEAA